MVMAFTAVWSCGEEIEPVVPVKPAPPVPEEKGEEIVLEVIDSLDMSRTKALDIMTVERDTLRVIEEEDFFMDLESELYGFEAEQEGETKATEIKTVPPSLYWLGSTGTWKSETLKYGNASASVSGGKLATGKYQTATATAYNYYVSNVPLSFAAGGSTVAASNATDVIAGCTTSATNSTAPLVTLRHVFARTGTLTLNSQTGFTVSNVSWKIKSKAGGTGGTSGTYNVATDAWSGVTALAEQAVTSDSDLYLTPGVYTVTCSYTLSANGVSTPFTKTGDVTFSAGKIYGVTATAVGGSIYTEYEAPVVTVSVTNDIPAGGSTSFVPTKTVTVTQRSRTVTNGVAGAWSSPVDVTASATLSYSKTSSGFASSVPTYSQGSLGTTPKERTKVADLYVNASINGKSNTSSAPIYQQANVRTYGTPVINTFTYPSASTKVAAAGGTDTPTIAYSQSVSYTSGSSETLTSGGTIAASIPTAVSGASIAAGTGVVTWGGNAGSSTTTYGNVTVSLSYADFGLAYDTHAPTLSYSQVKTITGTSTSARSCVPSITVTMNGKTSAAKTATSSQNGMTNGSSTTTLTSGASSIVYSMPASGDFSLNTSNGNLTAYSNYGSAISAYTEYMDPYVSLSYPHSNSSNGLDAAGGASSPSLSYSQEVRSYDAGRKATSACSTTVSVSVTMNGKTGSTSTTVTQDGDPGSDQTYTSSYKSSGATVSYGMSYVVGFNISSSTGVVTADPNLGSTTIGDITASLSYPAGNIAATGGSKTPTLTYSQTISYGSSYGRYCSPYATVSMNGKSATGYADGYGVYQKGVTASTSTVTTGATVTYSGSATGFTLASNGTVTASDNSATSTTYGTPTVDTYTYSTANIGQGGGSTSVPSVTYSQTKTVTGTSSRSITPSAKVTLNGKSKTVSATVTQDGVSSSTSTLTTGGTLSFGMPASTGFTLNTSNGVVSASSNYGAKTTTGSVTYDAPVVSFSHPDVDYNGGTSTPTVTYSQTKTTVTDGYEAASARFAKPYVSVTMNGKTSDSKEYVAVSQNGGAAVASTTSTSYITSGATLTFSRPSNSTGVTSFNSSNGAVTWGYNGSNVTRTQPVLVSVSLNGKYQTASSISRQTGKTPTVTYSLQAANILASYTEQTSGGYYYDEDQPGTITVYRKASNSSTLVDVTSSCTFALKNSGAGSYTLQGSSSQAGGLWSFGGVELTGNVVTVPHYSMPEPNPGKYLYLRGTATVEVSYTDPAGVSHSIDVTVTWTISRDRED